MIDCIAVFVSSFSSFSGKVLILTIFTIMEQLPLLRKLYWANHILFKYCLKTGFWKVFFTTVKCLPSNINKAYNNKGYTAIVEPVFLLSKLTHLVPSSILRSQISSIHTLYGSQTTLKIFLD